MKLGLYGGTFSPPHLGHTAIAEAFVKQLELDELLVMPTSIPPHKMIDSGDDPEKRFLMAKLAFGNMDSVKVSRLELEREGKSYTALTLRRLFEDYGLSKGSDRIYLLVGADMFLSLDTWYSAEEIFSLAVIVYAKRGNYEEDEKLAAKAEEYREKYSAETFPLMIEPFEISSSQIRSMIRNGEDAERFMPKKVFEYVKKEGLYAPESNDPSEREISEDELSNLREEVAGRLSEKRFRHTLAVEEEAAFMAKELLPEKLRQIRAAALLHDIAKELSSEKQLNYIKDFGIIKKDYGKIPEPVLHALAAPGVIVEDFPEYASEEILSAVSRHTTGEEGMSVFDAIVFLADYTECTRKHETCKRCREYFHGNIANAQTEKERIHILTEAVKMSLYDTIRFNRDRGRNMDPNTEKTYEWLKNGGQLSE